MYCGSGKWGERKGKIVSFGGVEASKVDRDGKNVTENQARGKVWRPHSANTVKKWRLSWRCHDGEGRGTSRRGRPTAGRGRGPTCGQGTGRKT